MDNTKVVVIGLVIVLVIALGFAKGCESAEWHVGISAFGGYDHATWDKGPERKMSRDIGFWMVAGQVRSDIIELIWDLQPTLELSYQQREYNFDSVQTPIQRTSPQGYSGLIGVTKEWKWVNGYLLGGVTYWDMKLRMVEANGLIHGGTPTGLYGVIDGGLYKTFRVWKKLTLSPEFKVYVYPVRPGMQRCRDFVMGYVNSFLGIRFEW